MEAVASESALEALRMAVLGLRMADRDAPGTGTQEALADALKVRDQGPPFAGWPCRQRFVAQSTAGMPQGLLRMLHKRPRIAAELRRPQGERRRGRAGLLDLAALLEWLWGQTAVPERRARAWVQWLHARLARLDLEAAHAEADAQVLSWARGPSCTVSMACSAAGAAARLHALTVNTCAVPGPMHCSGGRKERFLGALLF